MALLTRWDPWSELAGMHRAMDRLFGQFLAPASAGRSDAPPAPTYYLPSDVEDTGGSYRVTAPLPGFKPEEVEVTYQDGVLSISAEHKTQSETQRGSYVVRELSRGNYRRSFQLPVEVVADDISAKFQDGMLTVELPKVPGSQPKKIAIASSSAGETKQLPVGSQS
jgi:HSP20 family protein